MNLNPVTIIDSILVDYASPRVRRLIHSLIALAVALVAVWLAAEGNWKEALGTLAVSLYAAANKANTPAAPVEFSRGEVEEDPTLFE